MTRQEQPVTFHLIRGGRFGANFSPRIAEQLSEAIATMAKPESDRPVELGPLKTRLSQGQQLSQGDVLSLLRIRPHFHNLSPEAQNALEQAQRYVGERMSVKKDIPGTPGSVFNPLFVLPPKPTSAE